MFRLKSIILLGAVVLALSGCKEKVVPPTVIPEVDTTIVKKGQIVEYISAVSSVLPQDTVDLVARVEGYLIKRHFTEGQKVTKGQLLYEIEPEIYEANVKSAEADLENAHAALKNATINYERQKILVQSQAVSERSYDEMLAKKMEAEAKVKSAEAQLAIAKQNLSYTKIYATFDGWIGLAPISEGNMVNITSGTLATVEKTDTVRVEFVLNELDLLKILEYRNANSDDKLKIRLFYQDGSEYTGKGEISYWNNTINQTTGTLKLQAVFENKDQKLIPGMFTRIHLEPEAEKDKLLIPQLAVMTDQAGDYVYVVGKDGVVARRTITTGFKDDVNIIVVDKLQEGEEIIVNGLQKTRPGQKVTTKNIDSSNSSANSDISKETTSASNNTTADNSTKTGDSK